MNEIGNVIVRTEEGKAGSAARYLTLAAFARYPCKHGYLAHYSAGIKKRQETCRSDKTSEVSMDR